jgi:hypothetical protein
VILQNTHCLVALGQGCQLSATSGGEWHTVFCTIQATVHLSGTYAPFTLCFDTLTARWLLARAVSSVAYFVTSAVTASRFSVSCTAQRQSVCLQSYVDRVYAYCKRSLHVACSKLGLLPEAWHGLCHVAVLSSLAVKSTQGLWSTQIARRAAVRARRDVLCYVLKVRAVVVRHPTAMLTHPGETWAWNAGSKKKKRIVNFSSVS